jgi:predicted translin family RNA/ssDNA-binding protein
MSKAREALQKKAQKAIFQEAFLRWESAVVISLTLLMTVFGNNIIDFIPQWAWLLGGTIAEAGLVFSSLSDAEFGRKVVADLLRREFQPERLKDKLMQQKMNEALDYRGRIEKAIREQNDSMIKDELNQTASQIDEWLENIYDLAQRIDRYQQEKQILERDRNRTSSRIAQLNQQLSNEDNPAVRQQIESTLKSMERQLNTLNSLDSTIKRARLQLENSLVHLGTIYSQTMLVDVKDVDSGRARRLREEISEEVTELNDMLLAMDEVYTTDGTA